MVEIINKVIETMEVAAIEIPMLRKKFVKPDLTTR